MGRMGVGVAVPGIAEGDYTGWTWKWTNNVPNGMDSQWSLGAMIDDVNDIITLIWADSANKARLGLYNAADFSEIAISTAGVNYIVRPGSLLYMSGVQLTMVDAYYGGASKSLVSYIAICRYDEDRIEVWRGGYGALWSHDTSEEVAATYVRGLLISPSGKYVLVSTNNAKLILYEGN